MDFAKYTVDEFSKKLASDSPTPGGGSIAGLNGALSASLASMVVALTKDDSLDEYAEELKELRTKGLNLIDEDAVSFDKVMDAFKMSKDTKEEKQERNDAIQEALKNASFVPLETMKLGLRLLKITRKVVERGNKNAISDAGVAALTAMVAIKGGSYNVLINAESLKDKETAQELKLDVNNIIEAAEQLEAKIEEIVNMEFE
ncbi:cyclodeaminase/cyclohydrolase family protein [Selenihalanaerobacter shriftii]|uniref:Formimidoyltetrahydrofolate cyclodeaminase n=1 Tax=Selenihalanaerobacter shriftii TaxID=142842 RepID=A0A1T4R1L5_9FIRM|nr:cyclodeaminase/cyclohydrolase family protein [Selenihalanaerobacter shriftii]SKA09942.1 Formimidoyltetrahydrofolate cyclodeaminase [Selenihalanaerobacter shriftii]